MITDIYYSRKNGHYYYTGIPVCDYCDCELNIWCFHKGAYNKKEKIEGVYCEKCIRKIKFNSIVENNFMCIITNIESLPSDSIRFIPQPAQLKNGNITNYDLNSINKAYKNDTNQDLDYTRYSYKTEFSKLDYNDTSPILKGGSYNDYNYLKKLENENNLDYYKAKKLLEELRDATPIKLGHNDRKFIEFKIL